MDTLREALSVVSEQLHECMDTLLPREIEGRVGENRLARAMRYSALGEGKRLRPFLVITCANLFGVSQASSLQVAAAIEFIHAYSLVHDDLPAMDNDDERRGKPSLHKAFDEATAILAGDALLTLAFEVISHPSTHTDNGVRAELAYAVAQAVGARGMVGGQVMDMLSEERELNIDEITRLQRMKTGALFAVSCEAGAILGKASKNLRNALRGYAHDIGLAFQITDDLLDALHGDKQANDRQNKSAEKGTYVSIMGIEKAKRQAKILADQAVSHLGHFGKQADCLRLLARFVVEREQ